MTYEEQAKQFDWRKYDRLNSEFADGLGATTERIASRHGMSPCDVRQILFTGARLSAWRPGK